MSQLDFSRGSLENVKNPDFQTQTFGKWILTGEHSVLRGASALVFPIKNRFLNFSYYINEYSLELVLSGDRGSEFEILIWGVIEKACEYAQIKRSELKGKIELSSNIPVGAGMGASAALCVAISRWIKYLSANELDVYEFSKKLENIFHGESSGVDIAVAMSGEGMIFNRSGLRDSVKMNWSPNWFISYSGKRGITADCVSQVKQILKNDPMFGEMVDEDMKRATALAYEALQLERAQGISQLKQSIDIAKSCFDRWGLIDESSNKHMLELLKAGAIAVKPTGSGAGGFVLSLWDADVTTDKSNKLFLELIKC